MVDGLPRSGHAFLFRKPDAQSLLGLCHQGQILCLHAVMVLQQARVSLAHLRV